MNEQVFIFISENTFYFNFIICRLSCQEKHSAVAACNMNKTLTFSSITWHPFWNMLYYPLYYADDQRIFEEFLMDADADADSCNTASVIYEYTWLSRTPLRLGLFCFFQKAPSRRKQKTHITGVLKVYLNLLRGMAWWLSRTLKLCWTRVSRMG